MPECYNTSLQYFAVFIHSQNIDFFERRTIFLRVSIHRDGNLSSLRLCDRFQAASRVSMSGKLPASRRSEGLQWFSITFLV